MSFFRYEECRMFDWNDVRHFLAVARSGSTLTAARALKVSQPTVARRIAALEAALGVPLFERRQAGYRLTGEGEALLPAAEAVEQGAIALADGAAARAGTLEGVVKLTSNEMAGAQINPLIGSLRDAYPGIRVDLIATEAKLDLAAGEADIAIRTTLAPPQGAGLYVRKIVDLPSLIYCSRSYAEKHGAPRGPDDLAGHLIVGVDGYLTRLPGFPWFEEKAVGTTVAARASSFTALFEKLRSGLGVGVFHWGVFERDPNMIPCFFIPEELYGQVWLLTHERTRKLPHVRAVADHVGLALERWGRRARAWTIPPLG
jgi:DNA-binding transcriptional LysR family regulator